MNENTLVFPLGKGKLMLGLAGSIMFVLLGVGLIFVVAPDQTTFHPMLVKGIGAAGMLFFGATGVFSFRKMFDPKPGLILDADGITDHTNASSIGLIEWRDITAVRVSQVMSTRFLLIDVQDPEKYVNKAENAVQSRLMRANLGMYGTPLSITSNSLKADFNTVEAAVREFFWRNKP